MDDVDPANVSPLTDQQEILLSVLSIISGFLSTVGSSTIIYKVAHNFKRSAPYDRLLLGLSSCDILSSLTFAVSPFMLNKQTSQRVWASGNETTANFLGFMTQFSFAAIFYNGMLSYYYLLTVKYGIKRKEFARKYEKGMHLGTWAFFLATATVGAIVGFYNELEVGQGAWVVNWPENCEATQSCYSQYIGLLFGGIPTFFTFISLIVNNILIYRHVHRHLGTEAAGLQPDDQVTVNAQVNSTLNFDWTDAAIGQDKSSHSVASAAADEAENAKQRYWADLRNNMHDPSSSIGEKAIQFSSSRSLGSITQSTTTKRPPRHVAHIREVATQGFLYVACFALAYTAGAALRILEGMDYTSKDEDRVFWLLALDAFLKPLQGFLNIFVYSRPNYIRFRANYPELGRFWAMRKACMDPNIPKLPKGASVGDEWHDTTFRGLQRLTAARKSRSLSRSGTNRPGSYISDLAVVREASCEDDANSRTSDTEEKYEDGPVMERFTVQAPKSYRQKPPSKFSWCDESDGSPATGSHKENTRSSQHQDLESGIMSKKIRDDHDSLAADEATSDETSSIKDISESEELKFAEEAMVKDMQLFYQGLSQPSTCSTVELSPRACKRLNMDGSVFSLDTEAENAIESTQLNESNSE